MNIKLEPKEAGYQDYKNWIKQSFDLLKRKPLLFISGIIVSGFFTFPLILLVENTSNLLMANNFNAVGICFIFFGLLLSILFNPAPYLMVIISESIDENRDVSIITELAVIFTCFMKKQLIFAFRYSLKIGILVAMIAIFFEFFYSPELVGQSITEPSLLEMKDPVPQVEDNILSKIFGFAALAPILGVLYLMMSSIRVSPIYYLLIIKGVIDIETATSLTNKHLSNLSFMYPIVFGVIILPFFIILLSFHLVAPFSVIILSAFVSMLYIFYYVAARDRFFGKKENTPMESKGFLSEKVSD